MKKLELANKFNEIKFQLKKHSPEILVVAGVAGAVTSAVLACRATLKVNEVLNETKETIDKIHESAERGTNDNGVAYSVEDSQKDIRTLYLQTGMQLVKLYAPSVILGSLSVTGILASNNILRKRNMALAAAYATVDTGFKAYRGRVVERFGEEVDRQLKYNAQPKEVEKTVTDENGEEKTVKILKQYVDPTDVGDFARFFSEYTRDENGNVIKNHCWNRNNEYNMIFLKAQQRYANDLLKSKRRLFLNEVYDMLGLPRSKAGQIVGWVYDPENPNVDSYIDFGILSCPLSYDDFVYGNDDGILLDFNVDGNVWETM